MDRITANGARITANEAAEIAGNYNGDDEAIKTILNLIDKTISTEAEKGFSRCKVGGEIYSTVLENLKGRGFEVSYIERNGYFYDINWD